MPATEAGGGIERQAHRACGAPLPSNDVTEVVGMDEKLERGLVSPRADRQVKSRIFSNSSALSENPTR